MLLTPQYYIAFACGMRSDVQQKMNIHYEYRQKRGMIHHCFRLVIATNHCILYFIVIDLCVYVCVYIEDENCYSQKLKVRNILIRFPEIVV